MKNFFICLILIFTFFSSGLAEDPKEIELLFMAKKAYEDGFYEVSLGMLERFQNEYGNSQKMPQVLLLSGQCYFNQGRYTEALNIFEKLARNPQAVALKDAIYFWSAEIHFKGGNYQRSSEIYQKLITEFPHSSYCPAAYYSLGWSFSQIGEYRQAISAFKNLLEKYPGEPQSKDAAFKLVECLYNLKEYRELKYKINPILKMYASDKLRLSYLYFYLAESEYYLNNLEEASRDYLKSAQGSQDPKVQALAKLGLGWSYLKLAKYRDAQEVFSDIKPDIIDKKSADILLLGQAALFSSTNRIFEAKKLYTQLINASSDPLILAQAYLGKADSFFNLAEYADASATYKQALDKFAAGSIPEELLEKLEYNLGLSCMKQGRIDQGSEILEKVIAKKHNKDEEINLLFQIGDAYAASGDYLKCENYFKRILDLYPDSPYADYAQFQIGLAQLKNSDYASAQASFEAFLKKFPQSKYQGDALYSLGLAYFQKGNYEKSAEIFSRFKKELKENPSSPQALYMLGASMVSIGKIDEAIEIFREIPKVSQDAELLQKAEYEIADCYFHLGQENEAALKFKALRTKYPDSKLTPDILWWLGKYYYRQKDLNLARRYFVSLTKDYLSSNLAPEAFYALGVSFNDENKFAQAAENFKMAAKLGNPQLKNQSRIALGDVYARQSMFDEAIKEYKDAASENPEPERLLFPRIADAYYRSGDYDNAKSFYLKSIDAAESKDAAGLHFSLGEVLEARGEFEPACQQYLLSADLNNRDQPEVSRALFRAAKIYEDREDYKTALKIYNRIDKSAPAEYKFAQERIEWIKSGRR